MMIKPPDFDSMNLDNWFNTMLEDEYLYSVMMRNGGLAYFLADNTTCYRIHNSGLNSKQSLAKQVYFKIRLLHNIKLEFQDDKKALSIIHQTIKERMEPLFHYTFEGVKGIPRFDLIRLFLRYRTRVFIDLRLYYNWYLKRLFGR